jgi:sugar lactone lactonase YvrE
MLLESFPDRPCPFFRRLVVSLTLACCAFTLQAQSYTFTTLAGTAGSNGQEDGPRAALFSAPGSVAGDAAGNLYVADADNHTIRKISPTGVVTTLAGKAGSSGSTDGIGSDARFSTPRGVAVDGAGIVYVADTGNHTIRKITSSGVVSTFAGTPGSAGSVEGTGSAARFNGPAGVALDASGKLYVADAFNATSR